MFLSNSLDFITLTDQNRFGREMSYGKFGWTLSNLFLFIV